ncbi:amidohydrolase family protein [Streptomyces sp. NPDC059837]|uniref:amidohydrolase family protein n=1 Tax=Streptomyces sp. NPDC059837 TaxID=3346968 RepID=UPI00365B2D06
METASLTLAEFAPRPELVTRTTSIDRPHTPVVDAHSHLGDEFGGGWHRRPVAELLDTLDASGVELLVDLDGGWGEAVLDRRLRKFKEAAPDRFACFGGIDWAAWSDRGDTFPEWAAARLTAQVRRGAQGLKIWKPFGLTVSDSHGRRVPVDDPRLDPVWATAAELGIPVLIHVADPVAFFRPLDAGNERYELLRAYPHWHLGRPGLPRFETVIGELATLVARHPATTFIGAHVGCYAENLAWVSDLLDRCPNFYVDLAARLDELARQPYTARRFIVRHQDRVLFGTDWPADVAMYGTHYRFLETDDEHFLGPAGHRPGVSWPLTGIRLPGRVLRKVYRTNALRLLATGRRS